MKKKIIICVMLIVFLVALVPFPQNINRTFYGMNISDGEKASITIDMKYLRFLIFKDKIYGEITVTSEDKSTVYGEHLHYAGVWPANNDDKIMHVLSGFQYDAGINAMEPVIVYLSRDFNKILIREQKKDITKQYIGNIEENGIEETSEYFVGYID